MICVVTLLPLELGMGNDTAMGSQNHRDVHRCIYLAHHRIGLPHTHISVHVHDFRLLL